MDVSVAEYQLSVNNYIPLFLDHFLFEIELAEIIIYLLKVKIIIVVSMLESLGMLKITLIVQKI